MRTVFLADEFHAQIWIRWLRRFAREQRQGRWYITTHSEMHAHVMRASLANHHFHKVEVIHHPDDDVVSFEFLPCSLSLSNP